MVSKMNHFNLQQIAFAAGEEMRGSASIADRKEPVVCPRPRRVSLLSNSQGRPFRWHTRWFYNLFYFFWRLGYLSFSTLKDCKFLRIFFSFLFWELQSRRGMWREGWVRTSGHHSHEGKSFFLLILVWFARNRRERKGKAKNLKSWLFHCFWLAMKNEPS